MHTRLDILYEIENLIQTALSEHPSEYLEDSLQLLNEVISDIELSAIEHSDVDDENDIPIES